MQFNPSNVPETHARDKVSPLLCCYKDVFPPCMCEYMSAYIGTCVWEFNICLLFSIYLLLHARAHTHTYHSPCVKVRGQLLNEAGSLLCLCAPGSDSGVARLVHQVPLPTETCYRPLFNSFMSSFFLFPEDVPF